MNTNEFLEELRKARKKHPKFPTIATKTSAGVWGMRARTLQILNDKAEMNDSTKWNADKIILEELYEALEAAALQDFDGAKKEFLHVAVTAYRTAQLMESLKNATK